MIAGSDLPLGKISLRDAAAMKMDDAGSPAILGDSLLFFVS